MRCLRQYEEWSNKTMKNAFNAAKERETRVVLDSSEYVKNIGKKRLSGIHNDI